MIDSSKVLVINQGGHVDLDFLRVTMVHAHHHHALSFSGGAASGWVFQIPNDGPTIYHTGDNNKLADFHQVNEIY